VQLAVGQSRPLVRRDPVGSGGIRLRRPDTDRYARLSDSPPGF